MSDDFQIQKRRSVGVGGLKCPCCNRLHSKHRKMLNRIARARLKHKDRF